MSLPPTAKVEIDNGKEPITVIGLEKLKELILLKEKTSEIAAISEARSHGDLKENVNIMLLKNNNLIMKEEYKKLKILSQEQMLLM